MQPMLGRPHFGLAVAFLLVPLSVTCARGGDVSHAPSSTRAVPHATAGVLRAQNAPQPVSASTGAPEGADAQSQQLTPQETALCEVILARLEHAEFGVHPCHRFVRLEARPSPKRWLPEAENLEAMERQASVDPMAIQWLADHYAPHALDAHRNLAAALVAHPTPSVESHRQLVERFLHFNTKTIQYLDRARDQRVFKQWWSNAYYLGLHYTYVGLYPEARNTWLALLADQKAPPRGHHLSVLGHLGLGQLELRESTTDESRQRALVHFRAAYSVLDLGQSYRSGGAAAGCYVAEFEAEVGQNGKALAVFRRLMKESDQRTNGLLDYAKSRVEELETKNGSSTSFGR